MTQELPDAPIVGVRQLAGTNRRHLVTGTVRQTVSADDPGSQRLRSPGSSSSAPAVPQDGSPCVSFGGDGGRSWSPRSDGAPHRTGDRAAAPLFIVYRHRGDLASFLRRRSNGCLATVYRMFMPALSTTDRFLSRPNSQVPANWASDVRRHPVRLGVAWIPGFAWSVTGSRGCAVFLRPSAGCLPDGPPPLVIVTVAAALMISRFGRVVRPRTSDPVPPLEPSGRSRSGIYPLGFQRPPGTSMSVAADAAVHRNLSTAAQVPRRREPACRCPALHASPERRFHPILAFPASDGVFLQPRRASSASTPPGMGSSRGGDP